jgi:hypothetical protein
MSKPLTINKDDTLATALQGIMCEIISAQSSLNMYPQPIPNTEDKYLSESDKWAKHCMEHLRQLFQNVKTLHDRVEHDNDLRLVKVHQ